MQNFIEGTLLISNLLLLFFSIVYGFIIIKKKSKIESQMFVYFVMACALYFVSELLSVFDEIFFVDVGIMRGIVRLSFGVIVLFAFLSKYSRIEEKN